MIKGVFRWSLEEVTSAGCLLPEVVFVDRTHIKANVNRKKHVKKSIPIAAKRYQEQPDEGMKADRSAHGKKTLKKNSNPDDDHRGEDSDGGHDSDNASSTPPKHKTVFESTNDPESGVFHKGERKKCFAYEAHTVCEKPIRSL